MFILRRITSENLQINIILGDHYNIIYSDNVEDFKRTMELSKFYEGERDKIYAFIVYNNGSEIQPLYKASNAYYVMTAKGDTFTNVTYKS